MGLGVVLSVAMCVAINEAYTNCIAKSCLPSVDAYDRCISVLTSAAFVDVPSDGLYRLV